MCTIKRVKVKTTTKANEITDALKENFGSSGTIVNAVGGYTKENKQIVYFILNRFQMNKLKEIIREIDEKAFISFEEVSEISRNVEI